MICSSSEKKFFHMSVHFDSCYGNTVLLWAILSVIRAKASGLTLKRDKDKTQFKASLYIGVSG